MALTVAFSKALYTPGETMRATVTATAPNSFAATWGPTRSPGASVVSGLLVRTSPEVTWSDPDREWTRISQTATTLILEARA